MDVYPNESRSRGIRQIDGSSSDCDPELIRILHALFPEWQTRFGVIKLGIFGSRLHGTAQAESDLDILVSLEDPSKLSLFDLVRMSNQLAELTGLHIDLAVEQDLKPALRESILSTVRYIA